MRFPPRRAALLGTLTTGTLTAGLLTTSLVIAAFVGAAATRAAAPAPTRAPSAAKAAAVAAPTCGGVRIAKPGGGAWVCSFDDEFGGNTPDLTKWTAQQTATSGFHSGPECFQNRGVNVSVVTGALRLTARKEAAPFTCTSPLGSYATQYTSGSVSTVGKFTQAYGRYEVRAAVPASAIKGLQESFWLWPANAVKYGSTWPASGEIDIAELFSLHADRAIPFIHYNSATVDPNVTNNYCLITNPAAYHKYAVSWSPTSISVAYDGHPCLTDTWKPTGMVKPAPFDQPFMVALTQALGIGTNAFNPATTKLPATTSVDYVRVWK